MTTTYPALTAEQLQALRAVADNEGRHWKGLIRHLWEHHDEVEALGELGWTVSGTPILLVLRDTHGTAWLKGFRFPKSGS